MTNDDGIEAPGLRALAEAALTAGDEVVVVAPVGEQSGMGAAVGAIHLQAPRVRRQTVPGLDVESWAVDGPPALAVLLARMEAFGAVPDLVLSGINPGLNVGRSVYHSGTVGAAATARNGGIHAVAVSQRVEPTEDTEVGAAGVHPTHYAAAADLAVLAGHALREAGGPPELVNLNVPDLPLADMAGWRRTRVGGAPSIRSSRLELRPTESDGWLECAWVEDGDTSAVPGIEFDTGAVVAGYASIGWLGRFEDAPGQAVDVVEAAVGDAFGR